MSHRVAGARVQKVIICIAVPAVQAPVAAGCRHSSRVVAQSAAHHHANIGAVRSHGETGAGGETGAAGGERGATIARATTCVASTIAVAFIHASVAMEMAKRLGKALVCPDAGVVMAAAAFSCGRCWCQNLITAPAEARGELRGQGVQTRSIYVHMGYIRTRHARPRSLARRWHRGRRCTPRRGRASSNPWTSSPPCSRPT